MTKLLVLIARQDYVKQIYAKFRLRVEELRLAALEKKMAMIL